MASSLQAVKAEAWVVRLELAVRCSLYQWDVRAKTVKYKRVCWAQTLETVGKAT